jgi:glutamate-1-semialdehyde 2,1-aminomutase
MAATQPAVVRRPARPPEPSLDRSLAHQARAHEVIPGAAHTYAKGDDQFPAHLAPVIARGEGCHVWDLDGNRYLEFGSGLRSIGLGHGYRPVCDAAYAAMLAGTNYARPAAIELHAAERLLSVLPRQQMVKFAKHGSDCTTAAVKLARAHTGRDMVAVCADHPFFSIDDWFIGITAMNSGIPDAISRLTTTFRYNDLASLQSVFDKHPNQIACVMLEPQAGEPPKPGYLHAARELCHKHGALFVLDETITGCRLHVGGGQHLFDVQPDLSIFGKAIGNGFAVSALAGRREVMELGGIRHRDRDRCFLLSTTHGAETHALAALIANIDTYEREDVCGHMARVGTRLKDRLNAVSAELGLSDHFGVIGHPSCLIYFTADENKQRSQPYRTLFLQETIRRGMLAPNLFVNFSHTDADIDRAVETVTEALHVYRKALDEGIDRHLESRPVAPVFRKRN